MESKLNALFVPILMLFGIKRQVSCLGDYYGPDSPHHRASRDVYSIADIPQPSVQYPLVLFPGSDYSSVSNNGDYVRVKEGEYHVWGRTVADQERQFVYRSLIVMPNRTLTFKAGVSSGNIFFSFNNAVSNISDIHLWMFANQDVGGSSGVWYTDWVHWEMDFAVKVDPCPSCTVLANCNTTCYFGTCGIDGKCQCASGHSGMNCENRPTTSNYPSIQYPLILFPNRHFGGTPQQVAPDTSKVFAETRQRTLSYAYNSMRILHRRKVTFSRVDQNVNYEIPVGSDIEDIPAFMKMNNEVADALWINYSPAIELDFAVKVEDIPACTSCNNTGGSCFTGTCECLPGFSGSNCSIPTFVLS